MLVQQNKGINRCNTWYPEDNMWGFVEKCSCVKIWHRVLTLPVAMFSMRPLDSATVLYSNIYYTVVASIFLVSAASCKAIYGVASVRTSDYSQPLWLKWHALLVPHVLIKYAHVLICISAGEGSRHFSAFHYSWCQRMGLIANTSPSNLTGNTMRWLGKVVKRLPAPKCSLKLSYHASYNSQQCDDVLTKTRLNQEWVNTLIKYLTYLKHCKMIYFPLYYHSQYVIDETKQVIKLFTFLWP